MSEDFEETSAFSSRYFEITLYSPSASSGPRLKLFEGRTTWLNRYGLQAQVNPVGRLEDPVDDWENSSLIVKFHAISDILDRVTGVVKSIESTDHMLFRWVLTLDFEEELNLLKVHLE